MALRCLNRFYADRSHPCPPYIEVSSQESLLDQEIIMNLSHLQPKEMIRLQAQTIDDNGLEWTSFCLFQLKDLGEIDLSKQCSWFPESVQDGGLSETPVNAWR